VVAIISGHGGSWQFKALHSARDRARRDAAKHGIDARLIADVYTDFDKKTPVWHADEAEISLLARVGEVYGVDLLHLDRITPGVETIPLLRPMHHVTIKESPTWIWKEGVADAANTNAAYGEQLVQKFVDAIAGSIKAAAAELGFPT
jgi:creatinine amidohydrolase/Fe(II)-dependent formamide hydrolase-like protein